MVKNRTARWRLLAGACFLLLWGGGPGADSIGMAQTPNGAPAAPEAKKVNPRSREVPIPATTEKDLWIEPVKRPADPSGEDDGKGVGVDSVEGAADLTEGSEDNEGAQDGKAAQPKTKPGKEIGGDEPQQDKASKNLPKGEGSIDKSAGGNQQKILLKWGEGASEPSAMGHAADAGPAAVSRGQSPDGGMDANPAAEGEISAASQVGLTTEERVVVQPPSGSMADLQKVLGQRREHLDQREFSLAEQDLARFVQLKEELGVPNAFLAANLLIREAKQASSRSDGLLAEKLLDTAVRLAPDLPAVYMARTSLWFSQSPFKIGRWSGGLVDAAAAMFREPLSFQRWMTNGLVTLLLGLYFAVMLFVGIQFLRYIRLFFHDFFHLFPRGVTRIQTTLLGVILLLTPVIFRSGILTILIIAMFLIWLYLDRREKVLGLLVVAFWGVCPFLLQMVAFGLSVPGSLSDDVVAIESDISQEDSVLRVQAALKDQPKSVPLLSCLGGYYKRTWNLEMANDYYRRALAENPDSEVLLNNLGNVLFLQNDLRGALDQYSRATQVRPGVAAPYFNLSKVYFRMFDLKKGRESHQQALQLDSEGVRRLSERAATGMANSVVADLPLPTSWISSLAQQMRDEAQLDQIKQHLWMLVAGSGTPGVFPFVAGGCALLLLLLWLLRPKFFISRGCVRCGRPACRRCNRELQDDSYCGQCFHAFVRKAQVDARSKISKEIEIRQFRRRWETIARGVTFLLPGVGQLLKGRPIKGMFFLVVFSCILVELLTGDGLVRSSINLSSGLSVLKLVTCSLAFLGFYIWAILDAFRTEV